MLNDVPWCTSLVNVLNLHVRPPHKPLRSLLIQQIFQTTLICIPQKKRSTACSEFAIFVIISNVHTRWDMWTTHINKVCSARNAKTKNRHSKSYCCLSVSSEKSSIWPHLVNWICTKCKEITTLFAGFNSTRFKYDRYDNATASVLVTKSIMLSIW